MIKNDIFQNSHILLYKSAKYGVLKHPLFPQFCPPWGNYLPNQASLFGQVHSLLGNAPNYLVGRVIHKRMEGNADVMKVSSHHLLNAVCQKNQRGKIATRFKKRIKRKKHICKFHHIINHSCYVCCHWIASSRSRE